MRPGPSCTPRVPAMTRWPRISGSGYGRRRWFLFLRCEVCRSHSSASPCAEAMRSCPATPICNGRSRCWRRTMCWPTWKCSNATRGVWPMRAGAPMCCRWDRGRWPVRPLPWTGVSLRGNSVSMMSHKTAWMRCPTGTLPVNFFRPARSQGCIFRVCARTQFSGLRVSLDF